jgi:hypothetical protein
LPGKYDEKLCIQADKVLITGDGTAQACNITIVIKGKDCVLRNVWATRVEAMRSIVVVDSLVSDFESCPNMDKRANVELIVDNSCFTRFAFNWPNTKATITNCSFIGLALKKVLLTKPPFHYFPAVRATLVNCLIYSLDYALSFDYRCPRIKRGKLTFDGCAIYGKKGLVIVGYKKTSVMLLKDLKDFGSIAMKSGNEVACPKLLGPPIEGTPLPSMFIQTETSPTKDKGVDYIHHPILSKHLDGGDKKAESKTNTTLKTNDAKVETEKTEKTKKTEKKAEEDLDTFGGIPKPID